MPSHKSHHRNNGRLSEKSSSFHGENVISAAQLRRPRTVPDLLSYGNKYDAAVVPEGLPRQPPKVLLKVTMMGSLVPVQVLMRPESVVDDLVAAALRQYVKERRRPNLASMKASDFDLHYSQFSLERLDREEKLIELGSRNFFLCPRKPASFGEGGGSGGSMTTPFSSCAKEVSKVSHGGDRGVGLGTEVKVGEVVKVDPEEIEAYVHLSQAALGESKKDKANEPVVLHLKVGDQKIVLGTLSRDKIPQTTLEVVLDKEFELSHSSKSSSVFFCGYKALIPDEEEYPYSDEDLPLPTEENGISVQKAEEAKVSEPKKAHAKNSAPIKHVKIADPKKDDSDEDGDFGSSDDEVYKLTEMDDADSDDDEETPVKKVELGKKRANDSASKTPVSNKKAKNSTPQKTDGKKGGHTDTPHPAKKAGKTPNSDAKGQTPKSAGQFSCESCKKAFKSEDGMQQHKKAKHG
ncbi:unnamed protein product [Lupinus luteus]|uniref:C2H2-type domain-containing protein n=1 Tax=Lupinus luteus TaxID=3873 RepID=A0AAV1XQS0_LUPLU